MPDMRDELLMLGVTAAAQAEPKVDRITRAVIDSIPPGSFKRKDGTWVRLSHAFVEQRGLLARPLDEREGLVEVYTEVDHAE